MFAAQRDDGLLKRATSARRLSVAPVTDFIASARKSLLSKCRSMLETVSDNASIAFFKSCVRIADRRTKL